MAARDDYPIDHLGDESGLIPVSQRIDDAGLGGASCQQRPREHISLDIDHDDMPSVLAAEQRMVDAGCRMTGRIDDNLHALGGYHRGGIVGEEGGAMGD